jgi:ubiquitin-conjugating enzyme E2 variant
LLAAGIIIVGIAWFLGSLSWKVWLFAMIGVNANQIHKWAHAPGTAPGWVRLLQRIHVLQSPSHHAGHHHDSKNRRYCVITEALNPLLDRVGFWRTLESVLVPLWTAPRRSDLTAGLGGGR